MSQIAKYSVRGLVLLGFIAALAACSSPNSTSILNPETGKHSATWMVDHRLAFLQNQTTCVECHGPDLKGGISGVSCFSASFNGMTCHANGPSGHPAGWSNPAVHGASAKAAPNPAATQGFSTCQACHGSDFSGGISTIVCSSCHGGAAPHPISWATATGTFTHTNTDTGNATVCALCHTNGNLSPIAPPSPPAPAGTPPGCFNGTLCHATPSCGTCHGIPPNGTVSPNVAGQHAVHVGLGTYITCDTCHTGAGFGTPLHQNGVVDVNIASAYSAASGTAAYNAGGVTCSNVSCHGGQTTPGWLSGVTIDVNTQCASCHVGGSSVGNPQFNSYYSGRHGLHVGLAACTECHDTTKLAAVHFLDLNTPAMTNGFQTLLNTLNYTGTGGGTFGTCTLTCHGETHSGRSW